MLSVKTQIESEKVNQHLDRNNSIKYRLCLFVCLLLKVVLSMRFFPGCQYGAWNFSIMTTHSPIYVLFSCINWTELIDCDLPADASIILSFRSFPFALPFLHSVLLKPHRDLHTRTSKCEDMWQSKFGVCLYIDNLFLIIQIRLQRTLLCKTNWHMW